MADTGADIEKLKATGSQLQKDYGVLNHYMKDAKHKMYNMTVSWICDNCCYYNILFEIVSLKLMQGFRNLLQEKQQLMCFYYYFF